MPDLGKRVRYQAIAVATPTGSVPPRLVGILDGPPEGIIQFHELPGAGSIGDEKRGDLKWELLQKGNHLAALMSLARSLGKLVGGDGSPVPPVWK